MGPALRRYSLSQSVAFGTVATRAGRRAGNLRIVALAALVLSAVKRCTIDTSAEIAAAGYPFGRCMLFAALPRVPILRAAPANRTCVHVLDCDDICCACLVRGSAVTWPVAVAAGAWPGLPPRALEQGERAIPSEQR